jgi:hypothetical protein
MVFLIASVIICGKIGSVLGEYYFPNTPGQFNTMSAFCGGVGGAVGVMLVIALTKVTKYMFAIRPGNYDR